MVLLFNSDSDETYESVYQTLGDQFGLGTGDAATVGTVLGYVDLGLAVLTSAIKAGIAKRYKTKREEAVRDGIKEVCRNVVLSNRMVGETQNRPVAKRWQRLLARLQRSGPPPGLLD